MLKSIALVSISLLLLATPSLAQDSREPAWLTRQPQSFEGNLGVTVVDGKPYYLFRLVPELQFGKLTVGLNLNLRFGEDGKIRKEDFDETYDYFRIIRVVEWGKKKEPVYVRLGALGYSTLGHGFIVYKYRNNTSYDQRRVGMAFDVETDRWGFESLYSDLGGAGLLAARGFVRPLKSPSAESGSVFDELEVGATAAVDFHEFAIHTSAVTKSPLVLVGLDAGLPLISTSVFSSLLYADVATISDFGSGAAVGAGIDFTGLGVFRLGARAERRFVGDQFLPSYFDAFYERERHLPSNGSLAISIDQDKSERLRRATAHQSNFAEFSLWAVGAFQLNGSYTSPVGTENAGTIHIELETGSIIPGILLSAGYDRRNVGQVFKLDNDALLYAQVGYKPLPLLILSVLYEWTYREERDEQGIVRAYQPQRRIEPTVGLAVQF